MNRISPPCYQENIMKKHQDQDQKRTTQLAGQNQNPDQERNPGQHQEDRDHAKHGKPDDQNDQQGRKGRQPGQEDQQGQQNQNRRN